MDKVHKSSNLSVINHRQNPLYSTNALRHYEALPNHDAYLTAPLFRFRERTCWLFSAESGCRARNVSVSIRQVQT